MAHTLIRTSDRSKREVGDGTEFVTETYQYDERDRLTEITAVGVPSVGAAPEVKERYYAALARQPSRYAPRVMLSFAGLLLSAALAPLGWIGLSDRRRRRQVRHSSIALLLCVCMGFDPQQVCAFNNEAIRAHAMMVAGIGALGETTTTFAYDNNGNQVQKTVGSTTTVYVFDAENRLKEFGDQGYQTPTAKYTYDADGVRNSKTVSGPTTTDYLTDKNRPYAQVIEEFDTTTPQTPAVLMRYLYGDDLISQTNDPSGMSPSTNYFHYDGQMSTRQLTDDNGSSSAVTDHYKYDAFGQQLLTTPGPTANKYLYTGEQYDSDLGQYYLRARYYDQGIGRFLSRDPFDGILQDPVSIHKYLYAHGNPISFADPSGLFTTAHFMAYAGVASILVSLLGFAIGGSVGNRIRGVARVLNGAIFFAASLSTAISLPLFIALSGAALDEMAVGLNQIITGGNPESPLERMLQSLGVSGFTASILTTLLKIGLSINWSQVKAAAFKAWSSYRAGGFRQILRDAREFFKTESGSNQVTNNAWDTGGVGQMEKKDIGELIFKRAQAFFKGEPWTGQEGLITWRSLLLGFDKVSTNPQAALPTPAAQFLTDAVRAALMGVEAGAGEVSGFFK